MESQTGNEKTIFVWGLRYIDDLVCRDKGNERLYSIADPNWNVTALCNTSGAVVERMKYAAFGKVSWLDVTFNEKTSSNFAWNRTLTGQVWDAETGLMLYRNRFYHSDLGRFTQRDPIGYDSNDNSLYRSLGNSPFVNTDSSGLQSDSVSASIRHAIATGNIEHLKLLLGTGGLTTEEVSLIIAAIAVITTTATATKCPKPDCATAYPGFISCSGFGGSSGSTSGITRYWPRGCRKSKQATAKKCGAGGGMHYTYRCPGESGVRTILCCSCCSNTPSGGVTGYRCKTTG